MRVGLLGTRGVPARYGGFETCVEEVGSRLVEAGHDVVVYCRKIEGEASPGRRHLGMELVHLPAMRRRSLETLSHTLGSVVHAVVRRRPDVVVMFNAANSPFLPLLRAARVPVVTHVDGLEWQRGKWGKVGRRYYRSAESLAVRWSDALIADAPGIQDYYLDEFGASSELISYGAPFIRTARPQRVGALGFTPGHYHLVVARFEPENHIHVIVEGYVRSGSRLPLVVVGAAPYAESYTARVESLANDNVHFLGSVWDQELLDELYANSMSYLHGHSVGGTNPSLLRAIGAGAPTLAFDVRFNRDVLGDAGRFWSSPPDVAALVRSVEGDVELRKQLAIRGRQRATEYDWDDVARSYERLCLRLTGAEATISRASGRRQRLKPHAPAAASPR